MPRMCNRVAILAARVEFAQYVRSGIEDERCFAALDHLAQLFGADARRAQPRETAGVATSGAPRTERRNVGVPTPKPPASGGATIPGPRAKRPRTRLLTP
jgi:hypothetical protein